MADDNEQAIFSLRQKLCRLFDWNSMDQVCFTGSITESLAMVIGGLLGPGDHVIISSLEHNAVMRNLCERHIQYSMIPCDEQGYCLWPMAQDLVKRNTKAIIINACSNVFGTCQDLVKAHELARRNNLLFIVDSAQAAVHQDISMTRLGIDILCFTGHKSLLGPTGTGGFIINDAKARLDIVKAGGTGSLSFSLEMPDFLPDRYEPGTQNTAGLIGLSYSLNYVLANLEEIRSLEMERTEQLLEGLASIKGVRVIGPQGTQNRGPVISIDVPAKDNADIAYDLMSLYSVETRVGLHCSPMAHKALGTFPKGTIRLSPSSFTTKEEIDSALLAISKLV